VQYLKSRFIVVGENSKKARANYSAHYEEIFGTPKSARQATATTRRREAVGKA